MFGHVTCTRILLSAGGNASSQNKVIAVTALCLNSLNTANCIWNLPQPVGAIYDRFATTLVVPYTTSCHIYYPLKGNTRCTASDLIDLNSHHSDCKNKEALLETYEDCLKFRRHDMPIVNLNDFPSVKICQIPKRTVDNDILLSAPSSPPL